MPFLNSITLVWTLGTGIRIKGYEHKLKTSNALWQVAFQKALGEEFTYHDRHPDFRHPVSEWGGGEVPESFKGLLARGKVSP